MTEAQLPANLLLVHRGLLACIYALLAYFGVISLMAVQGLNLAFPVVWLIHSLPLLIFLPGLLQRRPRTHAWLSFVILLYFIHAVLLAFDPVRRWLGVIEVILCVAIFTLLILFIRQYRDHYQTNI